MRSILLSVLLLLSSPLFAQQPAEITIYLSPLTPIAEDGKTTWISQSVQQNIFHEFARVQGIRPILAANQIDRDAAIKAAKSAGANFLLEGSYTLADRGLRITLQLFDLRTNSYIGAAKATGSLKDLFALEDEIADQVKRLALKQ